MRIYASHLKSCREILNLQLRFPSQVSHTRKKLSFPFHPSFFFMQCHPNLLPPYQCLLLLARVPPCLSGCLPTVRENSLTYLSNSVEKEIKIIFLMLTFLFHYGWALCLLQIQGSVATEEENFRRRGGAGGKLPENSLDYKSININCFSTIGVRGLLYLTALSMEVYSLLSMVKCTR